MPVEGRGARTVRLDLLGVEASLSAGDTLRLRLGVSDDTLTSGPVVHHARPGKSRVRLRIADGEGERYDEAAARATVRRSTPDF